MRQTGTPTIEPDTKLIDCPEHPGNHRAKLYCFPHRYAGTWECPEGYEDVHSHVNLKIESVQIDVWEGDRDLSYDKDVYICEDCGVALDDMDPAIAKAEAQAEDQTDRGDMEGADNDLV